MKWKTLLAIPMLLAATAQAQVNSVNAVGMVKINIPANKLVFVSLPFVTETTTLDSVIGDQLTGAGNSGSSDRITIFNTTTQSYESFWKVEGTNTSFDDKWYKDDGQFPPVAADVSILLGAGFWIESRNGSDQNLIISGEVPSEDSGVDLVEGLKQIGFPYPVAVNINSPEFMLNDIAVGAGNSGSSDRIIIWDIVNQSYTPLWLVEGVGNPTFDGFWHFDDGQFPPTKADIEIGPGVGFWFERRATGNGTWTPTKPYLWP